MATTADIKRLYAFRSSLTVLDYADESVGPLKRLLLHCAIRPLILRCAEGRKLVAYFFSLHVPFIAELHRAVEEGLRLLLRLWVENLVSCPPFLCLSARKWFHRLEPHSRTFKGYLGGV